MKLTAYNTLQTPNGAQRMTMGGTLRIGQRDSLALGSVKRLINYDTDDLLNNLQQKSILSFLSDLNMRNLTLRYQVENSQIVPGSSGYQ